MSTAELDQISTSKSSPGFTTTSIGKKALMAVTGVLMIGFVIVHLMGNLQIFASQEKLNHYAETLQSLGALKWTFRIFLLAFFGIHIWKGVVLWWQNKMARPVSYVRQDTIQASLASRTMIWTGLVIFAFVVYHLLHFTLIVTNPAYASLPLDPHGYKDVYSMVILGFSNGWISAVYLVAVSLMAYHLSHATESFFQTLGLNNEKYLKRLKVLSYLLATVLWLGYISIPLGVLLKVVTLPGGVH